MQRINLILTTLTVLIVLTDELIRYLFKLLEPLGLEFQKV